MRYVIGVDYGTQSARAVVAEISTGNRLGEAVYRYPHGVMDAALPDGTPLVGPDWALEDPRDYLEALEKTVRGAVADAKVPKEEIGGIAIAATACTLLPVDQNLTPLAFDKAFASCPHAYAKLWKHHRAQPDAERMTRAGTKEELAEYGGRISSEWAIPKVMEVMREAPEIYRAADRFMQFSDWLTALLTGDPDVQNGSIATFKAMWSKRRGLPTDDYFDRVGDGVREIAHVKLRGRKLLAGERAGKLSMDMAARLGLCPGISVGMAHTDAHAAALGVGAAEPGDYVYILGTSSCGHLLAKEKVTVPGVTGQFEDGLIPGCTCYSGGQTCVGDMLEWYVKNALPGEYLEAAGNESVYTYLERLSAKQKPGDCGLIALDWWGGNRSPVKNDGLSGLIMGLSMRTRPEDIFRALLDAIAFGHRAILDNFATRGLRAERIILCGGIADKNRLLMQIMADVLNREVAVTGESQATARGAACCAAAAMGEENGGYATLPDAVRRMKSGIRETFAPIPENAEAYDKLYAIYHHLSDTLGREHAEWMTALQKR